jgi:protein-disulfide isomerase
MLQCVSTTRARWGSVLLLAAVTLSSLTIGMPAAATADEIPSVVATVQDQPISAEELTKALRGELMRLDIQRYQLLKDKLDDLIGDRILGLEAAQRGVSVQQLIQDEILAKVPAVTPEQVKAFYEANKNRIKQPLEKISEQIVSYLQQQGQEQRRQAFLKELRPRYPVTVALRAPKVDIGADGNPTLGPDNAPVTIIEFSDFQCPYCRQVQPTLKRLMTEYEGKVKLVFRDFPLRNIHPQAQKAAEAAQCAADQQKFWPYHDKLFATTSLQVDDLKKYAQELDLNLEQFTTCLDAGKYANEVEADMQAGQKAGVSATPTFFVNGYPLSGAASYERFKELLDAALEQVNSAQRTN